tara:strand:- start:1586 stop:2545 length:960 start_codon:yes stop_codon:yes gene_type:complete
MTVSTQTIEHVVLAKPRGFCAGVDRAVEIIDLAVEAFNPPVYCRKEIVHNRHVVDNFKAKGVIFVEELADVPPDATVVFSAHGVSPEVWDQAREKNLHIIDATCPLVTKVHLEVRNFARKGYTILYIGHRAHDEVVGVRGEAPSNVALIENVEQAHAVEIDNPGKVACLSQTTLSMDETSDIIDVLRERYPEMVVPTKSDICYATQNRQEAVKALAAKVDLVLVLGSENSSNSNRLVDVARSLGTQAHLIHDVHDIAPEWLKDAQKIGLTSGASTPEVLVERIADFLQGRDGARISTLEVASEDVTFGLPRELLEHKTA